MRRGNRQRPKLIGNLSAGLLVSLNPGVTKKFRVRRMKLVKLLQEGRLSGVEYEEAKKVLDGEGDARLLAIVRDLADGKLAPKYYPATREAALLKKAEAQIGLNRLTSPKGDNAFDTLQKVLGIVPGNPEAIRYLRAIGEKYKLGRRRGFERSSGSGRKPTWIPRRKCWARTPGSRTFWRRCVRGWQGSRNT
jgi:hypothetical protein